MLQMRARRRITILMLTAWASTVIAGEPALRIFTWSDDTARRLPGAAAMAWASVTYAGHEKPPGMSFDSARPAREVAREVAKALQHQVPERRAILLSGIGVASGPKGEPSLYPGDERIIEAYARGGLVDFTRQWSTQFWQALAEMHVEPAFIVLDYESGGNFWSLQSSNARDPRVPATAPDWTVGLMVSLFRLRDRIGTLPGDFSPLDFFGGPGKWGLNPQPINAFNEWAGSVRARALRQSVFEPAWEAFRFEIPASNFDEQLRAWPAVDLNGWLTGPGPISGNWSSPQTYLGLTGQRYNVQYKSRSIEYRRALRWLDRRNDVRSALACSSNVAPWYSNPNYDRDLDQDPGIHRLQWAAGLLHDRAMGVNVMLFWSDRAWTSEEVAFAQPLLIKLQTLKPFPPAVITKLDDESAEAILDNWLRYTKRLLNQ